MDAEPIKKQLHRYYDMIAGGVCLVRQSAEEQILFVNKEMLKLYQCKTEQEFYQLTKGRFAGLMEADDYMPLEARMNSRHGEAAEGYAFLAFRCYTKEGVYLHVEGTFQNGTVPGFGKVWMLNLVNKERSMEVTDLDPVTGLLNMHAFYQRVQQKADALRMDVDPGDIKVRYCPVYLNLTNFKVYNEMHGIYEGDRMLRKIGQLLKGAFPASYITHLSGDNFALFVPRDNLEVKLKEVCQAVNNEIRMPNITMKAGIGAIETAGGAHRRPITTYFDQAKLACDSIKKDATRFAAFYNESMRQSIADRIFILDNIDRAIREGHIQIYYQPVMRAMTGKLCGCEALARWIDPQKGLLPPDSFIPVLEESRLISRLDCYVIETVAKLLRYQMDNDLPMVPISVNLSHYDFLLMDPLAFVERIVERYHIPRYYLRIEVTESVLVKNRHLLIEKMRQFHQSGYQVWLDDFGSAYSSLNVLQNYEFDELKIDQGLLRYFNEDSRKIIRSIVLMAKTMGIHVLAEGAETKEHVDFLRAIGCEKIQGYYYGRPMPYELLREHCKNTGWQIETLPEEQALDAAGLVNLITDAPVAIFEYRKDRAAILSENEAYQKALTTAGTTSAQEFNANMEQESYPMREKFMTFLATAVQGDGERRMTFVENGQYLRLSAEKLAETPDFTLVLARLANITYDQDLSAFQQYETVFRNLMLVYDEVYFLDRKKNELHIIESMNAFWQAGDVITDLDAKVDAYARQYIYAEDRTRFCLFLDPESIYRQAERSGRSEAIEMFRVQKPSGRFVWMVFDAIVIYKSASKDILLCVRENIWERQENLHALLPQFLPYLDMKQLVLSPVDEDAALWHAIWNFSPEPLYWKDTELRYRGVNPAFLDSVGMKDDKGIIGKTDAELGWCMQSEYEGSAELAALQKETVCKDYPGTAIFRGVPVHILMTSFPIHQGGKITGILGYFHTQDEQEEQKKLELLGIRDKETGLLGYRGMIMAGMELEEDRIHRGEDYRALILQVPEVKMLAYQYSPDVQRDILRAIRDGILELGPVSGIASYIGSGVFICFSKLNYLKDLPAGLQKLKTLIEGITSVSGFSCTLTLNYTAIRGSEAKGFNTLLYQLAKRLNDVTSERWHFERAHGDIVELNLDQLSSLDDGIALVDINTYDLLFLNRALLRMMQLPGTPEDYKGRKCYELLAGRAAPCADCASSTLARDAFRICRRAMRFTSGSVLQRDTLVPWKGRTARFSIMTDLQHSQLESEDERKSLLHREEVINDIISLGLQESDPEEGVRKIIAKVGDILQAERVLIFEETNRDTVSATYEWRRDTTKSIMKDAQEIPRTRIQPLYDHFAHSRMLILNDVDSFLQLHPGFQPVLHGVTSLVSGHLMQSGRSIGFSEVINPASEAFASATFLLASLTSVVAIMLRNRDMIRRLESYSYRDQLTGVGNRRALLAYIRTIPDGTSLAFIFGGINGLKEENDTKGHEAGDRLIQRSAAVLVEAADSEHVFRMGGDEFLLIAENKTAEEATVLLKELQATYAERHLSVALGCTVKKPHRQHRRRPLRDRRPHVREQAPHAPAPRTVLNRPRQESSTEKVQYWTFFVPSCLNPCETHNDGKLSPQK